MKVLIVSSTPNADGLTAACAEAARQGVVDGKSPARVVNLNELDLARCAVCGDGWGSCRSGHVCQLEDDFQGLHETVGQAEAYVLVTPVYFGEPSEPMKAFLDRLRRCEATRGAGESRLSKKPTLCVAAAGGSGAGTVSCLAALGRAFSAIGADVVDAIPITRRTREYQLETIHDALVSMVAGGATGPASAAGTETPDADAAPREGAPRSPRRRRGSRRG